jgi:hypothetical protein
MTANPDIWAALIILAIGILAFSALLLRIDLGRTRFEKLTVIPARDIDADEVLSREVARKAAPSAEFDTRKARPLQPAVAAQRFAEWMRINEFTDYLWVGELDECFLWFCREENIFPTEAKALRELLYQLPGVSWGRPRIGGAAWERFRRQMENWHAERGLPCPVRPVVVRILPCEALPSVRVRKRSDGEHAASGREPAQVRTTADRSKRYLEIKDSRRVQPRSAAVLGSDGVAMRNVALRSGVCRKSGSNRSCKDVRKCKNPARWRGNAETCEGSVPVARNSGS